MSTEAELRRLHPAIAQRFRILQEALAQSGVPIEIRPLGGTRTQAQQRQLVRGGRSQTLRSRHLDGLAFDVDVVGMNRDDVPTWFWQIVGPWVETNLGMRWGGRWRSLRDYGHFEWPL